MYSCQSFQNAIVHIVSKIPVFFIRAEGLIFLCAASGLLIKFYKRTI